LDNLDKTEEYLSGDIAERTKRSNEKSAEERGNGISSFTISHYLAFINS
jgi:hypothetical protein